MNSLVDMKNFVKFLKDFLWHSTTLETYRLVQGLVAISNAGARAEDEKVESWANIFMVCTFKGQKLHLFSVSVRTVNE